MLITKNGSIDGIPHTSMVKKDGVWRYLLVCQVADTYSDEELTALFQTDTVEDDSAIKAKWYYTLFECIRHADGYKYVWLTYTECIHLEEQGFAEMDAALNILGLETQEVEGNAE